MKTCKFTFTFSSCSAPIADIAYMVFDIVNDLTIFYDNYFLEKDNILCNVDEILKMIIQPATTINLVIKSNNLELIELTDNLRYSLSDLKKHFGIHISYEILNVQLLGSDKLSDTATCVVCLENEVQIAYESCKHIPICFSCYSELEDNKRCVYCRTMSDNIVLKKNILNITNYYIP